MSQDPNEIITQLLEQNRQLRLSVAVLSAQKQFLETLENSLKESQSGLTPELISQISPDALMALQNMEIR